MDIGIFCFIGEEGKMVYFKVWLLFVIIENLKKVLLLIFYCWIFVIVLFLNFKECFIWEWIVILKNLFYWEVKWMIKDINVDEEIFMVLLENDEFGNVGSLFNKV